jgi:hypothetical protein
VRPEETPESTALTTEGTEVLESLKTAKNADLRALLEEFRPRVEAHLKEAKEIQRALPVKTVGMNR